MTTQAGTHFNKELIVFASAARTDTGSPHSSADVENDAWKGGIFTLDVTAASGTTPTLDVLIQVKNPVTGAYTDLSGVVFAQETTTGTQVLTVYPGIAETANVSVNDILPAVFKAVATIGGTTPSFTFAVGLSLIK